MIDATGSNEREQRFTDAGDQFSQYFVDHSCDSTQTSAKSNNQLATAAADDDATLLNFQTDRQRIDVRSYSVTESRTNVDYSIGLIVSNHVLMNTPHLNSVIQACRWATKPFTKRRTI